MFYRIEGYEAFSSTFLARHDTLNRRLEIFNVLSTKFQHEISLHAYCFHVIANVTQMMIEHSHPLFELFDKSS